MLLRMELLLAVVAIGIIQVGGLMVLAKYHQKALEEQNKTIKLLAMFKKANEVVDLAAMVELTEEKKEETKVEIKQEGMLPHEMNDEVLLEIRKQL